MFDEGQLLVQESDLLRLLAHYAQAGAVDREAWQDRVMQLDGVAVEQVTRLHGRLLACDWIEQNTGMTPALKPGIVAQCYRVTTGGVRALKRALLQRDNEEVEAES
jgi:hypothetical protein